ncbi:MAG: methanogenesis marker 17 protein [Candidatus Methanomethylicaceae archaeon]
MVAVSTDSVGGQMYEYIAKKTLEDLALGGSVTGLKMCMRSEIPLFIIKIKFREAMGKNALGGLANIEERENGSKITLESEIDLGDALKTLWSTFGRDKVEQSGRTDIIVSGVAPKDLRDLKIRDKAIDVPARINELAARIIPEGLRVRSIIREPGVMTFIAAEDPMREEWKDMGRKLEVDE